MVNIGDVLLVDDEEIGFVLKGQVIRINEESKWINIYRFGGTYNIDFDLNENFVIIPSGKIAENLMELFERQNLIQSKIDNLVSDNRIKLNIQK